MAKSPAYDVIGVSRAGTVCSLSDWRVSGEVTILAMELEPKIGAASSKDATAESGGVGERAGEIAGESNGEILKLSVVIVKVGVARLVLRSEVRRFKKLTESRLMDLYSS